MMMMIRFGRRRLHTLIISRETIKPSSPTPSNLRTYNLSQLDLLNPKANIPLIFFYPNNPHCTLTLNQKTTLLKTSLSHTLTRHYPFAGSLTPSFVDCNDEGAVFVEARNDNQMEPFRLMTGHDEPLCQLFADGVVHSMSSSTKNVLRVQLNHFSCGGVGLAVCLSHLIGDACSIASFVSHWAAVARYGSIDHKRVRPLDPCFIRHTRIDSTQPEPEPSPNAGDIMRPLIAARRFVFPNSKLSDLKNKVVREAGGSALLNFRHKIPSKPQLTENPTRVEVLTSLLYKTAVTAATKKYGGFKPSYLFFMVNMRNKFVEKLPETTIGNFVSLMMVPSRHTSETSLSTVVAEIKKQKLEFEGVQSIQQLAESTRLMRSKVRNQDLENVGEGLYFCSSFCGFPFSELDFGWGKPSGTTLATKSTGKNGFVLMDTPEGDGIEALVMLEEQHMEMFENDKELMSFCQTN